MEKLNSKYRAYFIGIVALALVFTSPMTIYAGDLKIVDTNVTDETVIFEDIIEVVQQLNEQIQSSFGEEIENLSEEDLLKGVGFYTSQKVIESLLVLKAKRMSLEYTQKLYDIPFESFIKIIPPHDWGLYLHKLLGRGISHVKRDTDGNIISQIERMILKGVPFNIDMTKAEIIAYEEGKITVYWRVFASENKSTLSDVGSVTFAKQEGKTSVIFRSAHQLGSNPIFECPIPNFPILQKEIMQTFLKHLESYKKRIANKS